MLARCKICFRFSLLLAALMLFPGVPMHAAGGLAETVRIRIDPDTVVNRISPAFIGFGYETSAVAQTNYFTAGNATLIRLYRNLGAHGLIRIGGNISDHTRYEADGAPAVHTERDVTIINRANLNDLAGFVQATGWQVMWGLNLGTGSKEAAAREAVAVDQALGSLLQSFEIGNEVDIHGRYDLNCGDFAAYHSNYLTFKAVIKMALPAAVFSGPDVAGNVGWLRSFANNEGGDIRLLTHHYYRTGARSPEATLENLLKPDTAWQERLRQLQVVSRESKVPFRINEINSFYGGGKAGVSDTFGSALWCLDNMFVLASCGCDGVNMETDINQLGWISHYSPIVHDAAMTCHARPEYYGMLASALAGKGNLLKLTLDKDDVNLTAYATKDEHGAVWLTTINKDFVLDAALEVPLPRGCSAAAAFWLRAPAVDAKDRVTFAGAEVATDGQWAPGAAEPVMVKDGTFALLVPHASAVVVRFTRTD